MNFILFSKFLFVFKGDRLYLIVELNPNVKQEGSLHFRDALPTLLYVLPTSMYRAVKNG